MDENQEKNHKKPDNYSYLHFPTFNVSLCITQHSCSLLLSYLLTSGFILNWSSGIKASLQSSNEVIVFPPCESHCFYCWHRLCKGETLSSQHNKVSMLNHHKNSSASSFIRATPTVQNSSWSQAAANLLTQQSSTTDGSTHFLFERAV